MTIVLTRAQVSPVSAAEELTTGRARPGTEIDTGATAIPADYAGVLGGRWRRGGGHVDMCVFVSA